MPVTFHAPDDDDCLHRSHYECVDCRKLVCARCGRELARASLCWKTVGYRCADCVNQNH